MLGTLRPSSYCSVRSFRPQPEDPQWPSPRASSRGTKSSRYSRWARWSSASSFEVIAAIAECEKGVIWWRRLSLRVSCKRRRNYLPALGLNRTGYREGQGFVSLSGRYLSCPLVLLMARKRKLEAMGLDEADRTLYSTFCAAANSLSQVYAQAMNQQKISFQAGERHALVSSYRSQFAVA
ncbi:hypothetical protein BHE74_00031446 [Ensete ventricosum]|nr:hypothetical protein BHE74_00031446 [Ensete ventricosum]